MGLFTELSKFGDSGKRPNRSEAGHQAKKRVHSTITPDGFEKWPSTTRFKACCQVIPPLGAAILIVFAFWGSPNVFAHTMWTAHNPEAGSLLTRRALYEHALERRAKGKDELELGGMGFCRGDDCQMSIFYEVPNGYLPSIVPSYILSFLMWVYVLPGLIVLSWWFWRYIPVLWRILSKKMSFDDADSAVNTSRYKDMDKRLFSQWRVKLYKLGKFALGVVIVANLANLAAFITVYNGSAGPGWNMTSAGSILLIFWYYLCERHCHRRLEMAEADRQRKEPEDEYELGEGRV